MRNSESEDQRKVSLSSDCKKKGVATSYTIRHFIGQPSRPSQRSTTRPAGPPPPRWRMSLLPVGILMDAALVPHPSHVEHDHQGLRLFEVLVRGHLGRTSARRRSTPARHHGHVQRGPTTTRARSRRPSVIPIGWVSVRATGRGWSATPPFWWRRRRRAWVDSRALYYSCGPSGRGRNWLDGSARRGSGTDYRGEMRFWQIAVTAHDSNATQRAPLRALALAPLSGHT